MGSEGIKVIREDLGKAVAGGRHDSVDLAIAIAEDDARAAADPMAALRRNFAGLEAEAIDEDESCEALERFDPVRHELWIPVRRRVPTLVIEEVRHVGRQRVVGVWFRPGGIRTLGRKSER